MTPSERTTVFERAIKMAKEVHTDSEPELILKTAKQIFDWITNNNGTIPQQSGL